MFVKQKSWRVGLFLLPLFLFLAAVPAATAFDGRDGDTVVIEEGEVVADDLYVAGDTVIINGTIEGDLIVGANTIEINGTVEGDVMGGGNSLVINGTVGDDVLFAGTSIIFANGSTIAGDVIAGGMGLEIAPEATVGGDVLAGGNAILLNGNIDGDVTAGGGGVVINGSIGGNVALSVGSSSDAPPFNPSLFNPNAPANIPTADFGLTVGESASIGGDFAYEGLEASTVPASAVAGEVTFSETVIEAGEEPSTAVQAGSWALTVVQRWAALLLIGWLLLRFMPNLVNDSTVAFHNNAGRGVLAGFILYFGLPIAFIFGVGLIILLAVLMGAVGLSTISGIIVGLGVPALVIGFILYIVVLAFISVILVGWRLGNRVMANDEQPLIPLALGILIVVLVTAIPYVGGIFSFLVSLVGLGALWIWWREARGIAEKAAVIAS